MGLRPARVLVAAAVVEALVVHDGEPGRGTDLGRVRDRDGVRELRRRPCRREVLGLRAVGDVHVNLASYFTQEG